MRKVFFIGADNPGVIWYIFLGSFVLGLGLFAFLGIILESFGLQMFFGKTFEVAFFVPGIVIALLFAFSIARWVRKKAREENEMSLTERQLVPTDKKKYADVLTACVLAFSLVIAAGMISSRKLSIGIVGVAFLFFAVSAIIKSYKGETLFGILKRIGKAFLFLIIIFVVTALIIAAFVIPISMYYNNPKNQKYIVLGVLIGVIIIFVLIRGFMCFKHR